MRKKKPSFPDIFARVRRNLHHLYQESKAKGGSQEKIAAATGLSQRTVSNLCSSREPAPNERNPTLQSICQLADHFGVEPWLLMIEADTTLLRAKTLPAIVREITGHRDSLKT